MAAQTFDTNCVWFAGGISWRTSISQWETELAEVTHFLFSFSCEGKSKDSLDGKVEGESEQLADKTDLLNMLWSEEKQEGKRENVEHKYEISRKEETVQHYIKSIFIQFSIMSL